MLLSFSFNGARKPYLYIEAGRRKSIMAPLNRVLLAIEGMPGAHLSSTETEVRVIQQPFFIKAKDKFDIKKIEEDMGSWLVTKEAGILVFDDEPDRVYHAVVQGSIETDDVGRQFGRGVITFICPDPYKYGQEKVVTGPLKVIVTEDYTGKVAGSTVENPHTLKQNAHTSLMAATSWGAIAEGNQAFLYDRVKVLDGSNAVTAVTSKGYIAQQLYSFNLIQAIERKHGPIPSGTTAGKVAWLKENITKLTANWHGFGLSKVANPTTKANFVGKVSGSTVENPHEARHTYASSLRPPQNITTNPQQYQYGDISTLNGGSYSPTNSANGNIAMILFSFNLVEHVERTYGKSIGATLTEKVQWCRDNLDKLTINWWGNGSGPAGNKATLNHWNSGTSVYSSSPVSHTSGAITRLSMSLTGMSDKIDSNGFVHFLAYADASDGVTASIIRTDFVELEITVKEPGNKASFAVWAKSTNAWVTITSTTASAVTKLAYPNTNISGTSIFNDDGIVYFLAHAEASNGITTSTVNSDYFNLELELKLPHLPLILENEGSAESYPVITCKLKKDTTFVAVGNGEEINMIGEPLSIDEVAFEPRTIILNDSMASMVGWGAAGFTPDGAVKAGTIVSNGSNLVPSDYGAGSAWHGPAIQKSLSQTLQDFAVEFTFNFSSRLIAEIGKVQLYGLSATNKKIFMLGMADYWNSQETNMPEGDLFNASEQKKPVLVRNAADKFERFYGYMRITRIGREIEFFLKQVDSNGKEIATKTRKFFDSANEYQQPLSGLGLHFAQYGTQVPVESIGGSHVTVSRINQNTGIPYIGRAGDVVEFHHKDSLITLNGTDVTKEKAFIGEYFFLHPGQNVIVAEPADAMEEIEVRWPPAWR